MTESIAARDGRPVEGVVSQLARDDVGRKRFLKMAGRSMGAGAAASGFDIPLTKAQVLAAAGPLITS